MIQELDDATACEILSVIARARAESEGSVPALDPALRQALAAFARNMRPTAESNLRFRRRPGAPGLAPPGRRPRDAGRDCRDGRKLAVPAPEIRFRRNPGYYYGRAGCLANAYKVRTLSRRPMEHEIREKTHQRGAAENPAAEVPQLHKVNAVLAMKPLIVAFYVLFDVGDGARNDSGCPVSSSGPQTITIFPVAPLSRLCSST